MSKRGYNNKGKKATYFWSISTLPAVCKWKVDVLGSVKGCNCPSKYCYSKEMAYRFVRKFRNMEKFKDATYNGKKCGFITVSKNCGGEWVTISVHKHNMSE